MSTDSPTSDTQAYDPVDTSKASVARAYDYILGGKDNYAADRAFVETMLQRDPEAKISARLNKDFGSRAVDYIARQGVTQFLDLGSGIPTSPPSVHETARRVHSDTKVVYVDHDPVVVAHNRALRATGPGLAIIQESFMSLDAVFGHDDFLANIDTSRPVGVLMLSVLQNNTDEQIRAMLDVLNARLAPGSFLAVSHVSSRTSDVFLDAVTKEIAAGRYPPTDFRTDERIAEFFTGYELVEPGIVDYRDWRPNQRQADDRPDLKTMMSGAVGVLR